MTMDGQRKRAGANRKSQCHQEGKKEGRVNSINLSWESADTWKEGRQAGFTDSSPSLSLLVERRKASVDLSIDPTGRQHICKKITLIPEE